MQAHVLNPVCAHNLLNILKPARSEITPPSQHTQVIVPTEPHLQYLCIGEQPHNAVGHINMVETEKKADVMAAHLQQRHLVAVSPMERRLRLCVKAQNGRGQQVVHSPIGLTLTTDHLYPSRKSGLRKTGNDPFVKFVKNRLQRWGGLFADESNGAA